MCEENFLLNILSKGAELIIQFTIKNKASEDKIYEFPTKVEFYRNDYVILSPILINNAFLNLDQGVPHGVNLIYLREHSKPIIWNRLKLVKVKICNKLYYAASGLAKGVPLNRRAGVRVYLGKDCDATIGEHQAPQKAVIKDISLQGFAITCKEGEFEENTPVRISFNDDNFNYHMLLMGEIVRVEQLEHTKLYGCVFRKNYSGLSEYINLKQREELIRHSEFGIKKMDYSIYQRTRKTIN